MTIHLLAVNLSAPQMIECAGRSVRTGIFKRPVSGTVEVSRMGLEGDNQVDKRHHGGADQALYLYDQRDYEWFSAALGHPLPPGTFGENLTLSDFGKAPIIVGDRFRIGSVLLEATGPRIPCRVLAARMGDSAFGRMFRDAERPGIYARVLEEGPLAAGMPVTRERASQSARDASVGLVELFRACFEPKPERGQVERILAAPIAERIRKRFGALVD